MTTFSSCDLLPAEPACALGIDDIRQRVQAGYATSMITAKGGMVLAMVKASATHKAETPNPHEIIAFEPSVRSLRRGC